jgi:GLPGLI family protein
MKKYFSFILLLVMNFAFSQTITGNYMLQLVGGVGGDGKIPEKSKEINIYNYTYSDSKSQLYLINPSGTQIDTIKRYDEFYDYHYETIESNHSFSKSKCVKDLKKGFYEKLWIIDGEETYKKADIPVINWVITNEKREIGGFVCTKASAKYTADGHTFLYTAWYSEKIPINDGPFEYGGLPGLILEISVENLFICNFVNFKYDENLKTKIEYIKHKE